MSDKSLQDVSGQSGVLIEMSGQFTYDAIRFNGEVISTGNPSSTDGTVKEDSVYMNGYTMHMPQTGTIMDLFGLFLPLSYGEVDTDGDGIRDHGAAVFNFKPNLGLRTGAPVTPIAIEESDTTVNINNQVFVTKQGIVFLNAPLAPLPPVGGSAYDGHPEYNIGGQTYHYVHPARMF